MKLIKIVVLMLGLMTFTARATVIFSSGADENTSALSDGSLLNVAVVLKSKTAQTDPFSFSVLWDFFRDGDLDQQFDFLSWSDSELWAMANELPDPWDDLARLLLQKIGVEVSPVPEASTWIMGAASLALLLGFTWQVHSRGSGVIRVRPPQE